jgi:hypothetical protein
MYDLRRFFPAQYLASRAFVCGFCLAAFSLTSSAATVVPGPDRFRVNVTGNTASVNYGGSGSLLDSVVAASELDSVVRASALNPTAGELSRNASIMTKHGAVGYSVAQRFSVGAVARTAARMAGPLGVGLAIAAPFIYDWYTDAGISEVDGQWGITSGGDNDGMDWTFDTSKPLSWRPTHQAACDYIAGLVAFPMKIVIDGWGPNCIRTDNLGQLYRIYTRPAVNTPGTWSPASESQIEQALLANSRTLDEIEKMIAEGFKAGKLEPDAADKPEAKPGTDSPITRKTETVTLPDGTVESTTRDCKAVSKSVIGQPSTLKLVEECTVTKTSTSPGGSPVTTTESTSTDEGGASPVTDQKFDICSTLVGKLICSDLDIPESEPIDKTTKTISYATENHFGGGACPSDVSMTTHNGQSLKVWDWATSCDKINQFFRPLFLTLCAFTALMILAPAVKEA